MGLESNLLEGEDYGGPPATPDPNPADSFSYASAPPPEYEDVVYGWSKRALDLELDLPPPPADERDNFEMTRRAKRIFILSFVCLLIDLGILIGGHFNGRSFGIFSIANILAAFVFAVGCINFFKHEHQYRVKIAQAFFFSLLLIGIIGVLLGFYYCTLVPDKVINFCDQHDCKPTTGLKVLGVTCTLFFLLVWAVFFSVFARSTFFYIAAAERSRLLVAPNPNSEVSHWVHKCAAFLPHYKKHGRRCRSNMPDCRCSCSDTSNEGVCICWLLFFFLLSSVLCATTKSDFWCFVTQFAIDVALDSNR
mmetsp:Transcript_13041/g.25274  ORF Transcript_13041/g.25274 Transcript_13041/m.25274 type:complete len:307 (-) Transcript_13041:113-1033(-)